MKTISLIEFQLESIGIVLFETCIDGFIYQLEKLYTKDIACNTVECLIYCNRNMTLQ